MLAQRLAAVMQGELDQAGPDFAMHEVVELGAEKARQRLRLAPFVVDAGIEQRQEAIVARTVELDGPQVAGGLVRVLARVARIAHQQPHQGLVQADIEGEHRHLGLLVVVERALRHILGSREASAANVELQHGIVEAAAHDVVVERQIAQGVEHLFEQLVGQLVILVDQHHDAKGEEIGAVSVAVREHAVEVVDP